MIDDTIYHLKLFYFQLEEFFHLSTYLLAIFWDFLHILFTGYNLCLLIKASNFLLDSYVNMSDNISMHKNKTPNYNTVYGKYKVMFKPHIMVLILSDCVNF